MGKLTTKDLFRDLVDRSVATCVHFAKLGTILYYYCFFSVQSVRAVHINSIVFKLLGIN